MESEVTLRHLLDLCRRADRTGITQYSAFCTPAEQDDFLRCPESARFEACFRGGYEGAERRILAAGERETAEDDPDLPIRVTHIRPASEKFAEELTHRDYLGAILALGLERSQIGDILVRGREAWVFCLDTAQEILAASLNQVRRTTVRAEKAGADHPELKPRIEEMKLNAASERLDAVVAAFAGLSRGHAAGLFPAGKVFVNSRPVSDGSKCLKEGDIFSVRGFGKGRYDGVAGETRKGRLVLKIGKYV